MQTVWKLRVGAEAYYLSQVASGLDEYYTGAGEAPGVWAGSGIESLGLTGEVDPADLRAVLAGLAPGTGQTPNGTTLRSHPRRVPGFDLTFAVPKSVSVAYAPADRRVQHLIVTACEAALVETLGWLEREACFVRRGTNKAENRQSWGQSWGTRRTVARGFVGAAYRHRTSRAGDPHLHWHVLVANLAQGVDGRWSALDGRAIYDTARTGGAVFQAAMRRELTDTLGVEWGPVHEDAAEIAGIPGHVLREFSQRHEQIAEWLDNTGESGPAAAATAQRSTRQAKQVLADFAAVEGRWHARADAVGWGPGQFEQLLASMVPATMADGFVVEDESWHGGVRTVSTRLVGFDEWLEWLLETRVTAHDGTFTRFDLTRAVASARPASTSVEVVEATVRRALASPAVVPLGDHWDQRVPVHAPCRVVFGDRDLHFTSRALLAIEEELVCQLGVGVGAGVGALDRIPGEAAIARSELGVDQADAVRLLASAGDRVAVMVGRAGTGKTHTLGTLRSLYEDAGYTVIGLAPSARAARELESGSGIGSVTIARHLVEHREIDAGTVVVVDEAGMAAVRDLARVVDRVTRVGAKLVLVGDHHQLPEVAAGGAFRAALGVLGGRVAELTINRRQQQAWVRSALDQLRHGDVTAAFAAYREHGRIVLSDDRERLRVRAIADWDALRQTGVTLMLAGTRAEAHQLNGIARQLLADSGEIDVDRAVEIGGRSFAPGEHVILRRNHRGQRLADGTPFGVDNGMRGQLERVDFVGLHVTLTTGERIVLDRDYVERGWLDYGYASTVHSVQGVTCDHVLVVGPAGLYREGIYVALSRARLSAWIYATTAQAIDLEPRHDLGIPLPTEAADDPEHELLARMQSSGAKVLASTRDPDAAMVADLASGMSAPALLELARTAHRAELAAADCCPDPGELRAVYERMVAARTHLDFGRRVRALDRDNVGHVVDCDDLAGTCDVYFVNEHGRSATRSMRWDEVVVIDHPEPVAITPVAAATIDRVAAQLVEAEQDWARALAVHGVAPGDAARYRRAVHVAVDRAAHGLRADPPRWLTTWLGPRPADAPGATVWDDTVGQLAHFRILHGIDESTPGLGAQTADPIDLEAWQQLMLRTLQARLWLTDRHDDPAPAVSTMSATDLLARRDELEALMHTAPPDHRRLIEGLTSGSVNTADVHEQLVTAGRAQDDRRGWIVANWPHVVELEQVNALIAAQPPLAHWPLTQPVAVQTMLDAMSGAAPPLAQREDRSLAEIDREAIANDPVRRIESQIDELDQLAARTTSTAERDAVTAAQRAARHDLAAARRAQQIDDVFARYGADPHTDARERRALTIAHDVLTEPPSWVIDHVRRLHDNGQLSTTRLAELTTRVVTAAIELDQHGRLPNDWESRPMQAPVRVVPAVEVAVPEL